MLCIEFVTFMFVDIYSFAYHILAGTYLNLPIINSLLETNRA